MGIINKIQQEDLEYIRLEHFMYILSRSIDGSGFNEFYLLPELLDKGLRLSYTESGYVFDEQMAFKGDVKFALKRLEKKLFDTNEPEGKLYKNEVVKTQDGLEISLGDLLVKRSDVEKVYSECKETKYPWSLVLWPQSSDDWAWLTVDTKLEPNSAIESVDEYNAGNQTEIAKTVASQVVTEPASTAKPRRKRKPVEKETSEGLLLVDELLTFYEIEYLDQLKGIKAWGLIISGGFSSDSIKLVSDSRKSIILANGEKLDKSDFLEKYRKRFNPE
ncbi:MAG: hypothetical protein NTY50_04380 [Methylobacter sp.]|nr:hypothetical protein [Methylobacter sp.]